MPQHAAHWFWLPRPSPGKPRPPVLVAAVFEVHSGQPPSRVVSILACQDLLQVEAAWGGSLLVKWKREQRGYMRQLWWAPQCQQLQRRLARITCQCPSHWLPSLLPSEHTFALHALLGRSRSRGGSLAVAAPPLPASACWAHGSAPTAGIGTLLAGRRGPGAPSLPPRQAPPWLRCWQRACNQGAAQSRGGCRQGVGSDSREGGALGADSP